MLIHLHIKKYIIRIITGISNIKSKVFNIIHHNTINKEGINLSYIITNRKKGLYICLNDKGQAETCSKEKAQRFDDIKARHILQNLPKRMKRNNFRLEPVADEKKTIPIQKIKRESINNGTKKVTESINIKYWVDKIVNLNGLSEDAESKKKELKIQLRDLEDEQQDLLHYIEFANFNAVQGWKIAHDLKICRNKRRKIKNELEVIQFILNHEIDSFAYGKIMEKIATIDQKIYCPRIRKDLFEPKTGDR